jgi:hypothetical protein
MKTRLTIIVIEISDMPQRNGVIPIKVLVDSDYRFLSKYLSTKSLDDTIQELLSRYSNLDIRYCYPVLSDFFHEAKSTESEVVYTINMPQGLIGTTNESHLVDVDSIEVEEKYVRSIEQTPRSIQ